MSAFQNYVTPQPDVTEPSPALIRAFRAHFCQIVTTGGTKLDFLAEFRNFRDGYINACMNHAQNQHNYASNGPMPTYLSNQIVGEAGKQLDQLLALVFGMGQISIAFNILPFPAPVQSPLQAAPEPTTVASSSKAKPKESRRYTHVLNNVIAKNHKDQSIHGIPEDAKDKVPAPEDMIVTMVEAMKDETQVLDFPDTKPYKDHWSQMKDPEFFGLARTLFFHLNQLHQGVDYIEGFCYADRYQNLLGLLQACKGTIYFMSRPSTYEDVLLNPHMMRLRFADNQKNNAKKKVDNKELTARRNLEYIAIHGCNPPPKERSSKGKKRAASTSEAVEIESEVPSLKPKRRKANTKKGKATANAVVVDSTPTQLDNGESSSAQGQFLGAPIDSQAFLGVPAHEYGQIIQSEEPEYYFTPEQELQQLQYQFQQQQQQPLPTQQRHQHHFNPEQNPPPPQRQQFTPGRQQSHPNARTRPCHTQTMTTSPVSIIAPTTGLADDIEQKVATTLSNAVRGVNYTPISANTYDSSYFSTDVSPISYQQQKQAAASYQNLSNAYPVAGIPYDNNVEQGDGQGAQLQKFPFSYGQYNQLGPSYQDPALYSQQPRQKQTQAGLQPVKQQPQSQRVLHQKPQNQQQANQSGVPNAAGRSLEGIDPCWSSGYEAIQPESDLSPGEVYQAESTPDMHAANRLVEDLLTVAMANQGASAPDEIFCHQLNTLKQHTKEATKDARDNFYPVDMDNPYFGDLPDIEVDYADDNSLGMMESGALPQPGNQNLVAVVRTSNTGGQAIVTKLGGQNKMKEMDEMLALDP